MNTIKQILIVLAIRFIIALQGVMVIMVVFREPVWYSLAYSNYPWISFGIDAVLITFGVIIIGFAFHPKFKTVSYIIGK